MVLGDLGRTRRLAGNPASSNVSDSDITAGLAYGTSQVIRLTGKQDWETDTANTAYNAVVTATEYFASSYVRDRFMDQTDVSTEHFNRATAIVTGITESLAAGGSTGGGGSGIASRLYRSYPLNTSAMVYRSMSTTGTELIGSEGYYTEYYTTNSQ
jgi:hypothetical protein